MIGHWRNEAGPGNLAFAKNVADQIHDNAWMSKDMREANEEISRRLALMEPTGQGKGDGGDPA